MNIETLLAATPAAVPDTPTPTFARSTSQHVHAPNLGGALGWCLNQYEAHHGPLPTAGGRNNWLAALALFSNERGVPLADLETHALGHYAALDFTEGEIRQTVEGIYTREAAAHGSKPYTTSLPAGLRGKAPQPLPGSFTPTVYNNLPDYLRRCCEPFEGHEKAVMLLGTLAVLSGCFPAVGGTYNKRRHGLNLFVFLIAPAASGKGTLGWARRLAWPHHKALTDASKAARLEYDAELAAYKSAGKAKAILSAPPADPPPYKMLYLPGNVTAAALTSALAENDGHGIMCETEADTLSGALGADFGNFSDVLRKAFHHEPVSILRKTDRQHLDLERPALSIALTGTPGQLPRLMPTAEDGLVSRFLFYTFEQPPTWQDVSPSAGPPLDPHFDNLGAELSQMIAACPAPDEGSNYLIEITLTPADWQRLNLAGAAGLSEAAAAGGTAPSTAYRLGLIAWRIVGLLTVLRCFENGQAPAGTIESNAADVGTALAIMNTVRAHALTVLESLPTPGFTRADKFATKAKQMEQAQEFHAQGMSIRSIADQLRVPKSTIERWIK